jgi:hypothetical protein
MLSLDEAAKVICGIERGIPKRPPVRSVKRRSAAGRMGRDTRNKQAMERKSGLKQSGDRWQNILSIVVDCHCPGSIVRFANWHRQIFLDSGILFRFKDS